MIAKSLDVVVLLKLLVDGQNKPYALLGQELGMSASEVHASVRRSASADLLDLESRAPRRRPLEEFLIHGVPYAFPAQRGSLARGIPTAYAAPPLNESISYDELPPVWPDPDGSVKGYALEPLYHSVPRAIKSNPQLYELLALVDAIRMGRARERQLAVAFLKERLRYAQAA